MAEEGKSNITLHISLRGRTEGQALPSTRAYLFDRSGRLVQSTPVSVELVQFEVAANHAYRVTVGPDLLSQSKTAPANLEAQLAQANSVSQDFVPRGPSSAELKIHPNIWFCRFPTCINVRGAVTKQFAPSGTAAICNGLAQINGVMRSVRVRYPLLN